jgi:hypothetical protein
MSTGMNALLQMSPIVEALNTPGLQTWKTLAISLSSVGIAMNLVNIVMYALYSRVYLAPNPMVERHHNNGSGKKKNEKKKGLFNKWGQSLQE